MMPSVTMNFFDAMRAVARGNVVSANQHGGQIFLSKQGTICDWGGFTQLIGNVNETTWRIVPEREWSNATRIVKEGS